MIKFESFLGEEAIYGMAIKVAHLNVLLELQVRAALMIFQMPVS